MRKALITVTALASVLGVAAPSLASTAAKKPPVKLSGKVNKHGTGKVKNGEVKMEADDFFFERTYIQGKKGETVTVTIVNDGSVQHTFTIDSQNIDETIDPDAKITVEVKIPKNGKPVAGYCRFHKGSGMQFAFFSKKGAKATSTDSGGGSGGYGY